MLPRAPRVCLQWFVVWNLRNPWLDEDPLLIAAVRKLRRVDQRSPTWCEQEIRQGRHGKGQKNQDHQDFELPRATGIGIEIICGITLPCSAEIAAFIEMATRAGDWP